MPSGCARSTGFAIGGVAPLGHPRPLPTAIDDSLGRFETVYAAAGHPYCVFPTTVLELSLLTGGAVIKGIAIPSPSESTMPEVGQDACLPAGASGVQCALRFVCFEVVAADPGAGSKLARAQLGLLQLPGTSC